MNDLLESAVAAHGGLDRWNQITAITVDASITGALWHVKGKPDVLKEVRVAADTKRQLLTMDYVGQDKQSVFEPSRVVIQCRDGAVIDARDEPERSFNGHQLTVVPVAPTTLTATPVSGSQIDLAWTDNAPDEDGFRIERCQGLTCSDFLEIATVGANATSYQNSSLAAGTSYSYRVRAYTAAGTSDYSASDYSNTATAVPPLPPVGALTATAVSGSQINLAWQDNISNEDGFRIER